MTITELIAQLEQLKAVHGDLKVKYHDNYEGGSCDIARVVPNYPSNYFGSYPSKKGELYREDKTQPAYQIELL